VCELQNAWLLTAVVRQQAQPSRSKPRVVTPLAERSALHLWLSNVVPFGLSLLACSPVLVPKSDRARYTHSRYRRASRHRELNLHADSSDSTMP
jgi:hypothetical protein